MAEAVRPLRRRALPAVAALLLVLVAAALWGLRSHGVGAPAADGPAMEGADAGRKVDEIPR